MNRCFKKTPKKSEENKKRSKKRISLNYLKILEIYKKIFLTKIQSHCDDLQEIFRKFSKIFKN